MRITGGEWRGRRLSSSKLKNVRPATDQQRQSVFNMLYNLVDMTTMRVLDLFAGSGSFGLEALSRGAQFALFVERHRGYAQQLKRAIAAFRAEQRSKVVAMNVRSFVALPRNQFLSDPFDLVFYDPPYHQDYADIFLPLFRSAYVQAGSVLVVKHSRRSVIPLPPHCTVYRQRQFGDTAIELWIVEEMVQHVDESKNGNLSGNV